MAHNSSFSHLSVDLDEYIRIWEWNDCAFLWHDLYTYAVYKNRLIEQILGFQENNLLCICENGNYSFSLQRQEIESNKTRILNFFLSSSYNNLTKGIKQILTETKQLSWDTQFFDWKEKFEELSGKFTKAASHYFCTEAYYVDCIYDYLIHSGYTQEDVFQFAVPDKMSSVVTEQKEWYELLLRGYQKESATPFIQKHWEKWKYIVASKSMNPYTTDNLHLRYEKDILNIEIVKQAYQEIKNHFSDESIEKIRNSSRDIFHDESYLLIERLREISYLRFELRCVWMKTGYLLRMLLNTVFPNNKSVFERTANEIINEEFDDWNDRQSFVYYSDTKKVLLFYNNTQEMLKFQKEDSQKNSSDVLGRMSFGLDVSGYAYILGHNELLSQSLDLVNEDTILVLPQLCPEHVPLLSVCKGIVVDEPGIAGHASIIAREMKKPAIIGTINGTQRIKNNEYIRLDMAFNCVRRDNFV